ncbi:MAG: hypothetical protein L5656_00595 [Thermanaeromonas sp.]|uniref:hypothetical protein n=1 Tax=Thermanaeromonas sp. TaxID=2003697 RepID=UPI0024376F20|nr:hypothetical protein [Thermanaeromonas sp.]MCG0277022.1 hypothetical protein [Thermanaeromonas sp.]
MKEFFFSAGVLAVLPVSLLFQRWLERSVEGVRYPSAVKAYNAFLARALLRMGASLVILVLASARGPAFLLGALAALLLPMLAYFAEAVALLVPSLKRSQS